MFRSRKKTWNFAVLAIYMGFSLGGPWWHHWTHHACALDCGNGGDCGASSTSELGPAGETGCDDTSVASSRHLDRMHPVVLRAERARGCCSHRHSGEARPNVLDIDRDDIDRDDIDRDEERTSRDRVVSRAAACCRICDQLASLMQVWGAAEPGPELGQVGSSTLWDTSHGDRGIREWIARSRAPPPSLV
jgi:hypothetical protein